MLPIYGGRNGKVTGYLMRDMLIGLGTDYWGGTIRSVYWIEGEYIGLLEKLLRTLIGLIAIGSETSIYWLSMKIWVDIIWRRMARWILDQGYIQTKKLDKGILECITARGDLNNIDSNLEIKTVRGIRDYIIYSIIIGLIYILI